MEENKPEAEVPEPIPAQPEEDYKDKYLRLLAESENMRKRMQKEKQEMTRFAIENVLADVIMPMDNLDNALAAAGNMSPEIKNWAFGFQMILGQFKDVLEQHGVVSFKSEGEIFDPHKHEAVESEESSTTPAGTILQEYVKGYRCGDRIIRVARVKVAKEKKPSPTPEEPTKGE
jgi:molecular chaperone GrpE